VIDVEVREEELREEEWVVEVLQGGAEVFSGVSRGGAPRWS